MNKILTLTQCVELSAITASIINEFMELGFEHGNYLYRDLNELMDAYADNPAYVSSYCYHYNHQIIKSLETYVEE